MKKLLSLVLALTMAAALAACGSGNAGDPGTETPAQDAAPTGETYSFAIGTNTTEDSNNHALVAKFKELLEEKSGGQITATLYENGQLGGDAELTQGVIDGSIDFIIGNPATVVDYVPEAAVFDMPSVFPSIDTARKVMDDQEFLALLKDAYGKAGISLLGFGDSGYRIMSSNVKVEQVSDFSGIKIRTMNNNNHIAYWQALSANPTPMDFNEVYTCLEQGTLDAQENPYDLIYSSKFYECQDYVVETNHLVHVLELIGSKSVMDGLPADIQALIEECALEASAYERTVADDRIEDEKATITDAGTEIVTLSDAVVAEMGEKATPIYDQIRGQIGDELVDTMLNLAQQYSK